MDFEQLAFGLTPSEIADIVGVHVSTGRRWKQKRQAPAWAVKLLEIHRAGALPTNCPTWSNWRMRGSWLIDPAGIEYSAGDVMGLWIVDQLRRDLERRVNGPAQFLLDI